MHDTETGSTDGYPITSGHRGGIEQFGEDATAQDVAGATRQHDQRTGDVDDESELERDTRTRIARLHSQRAIEMSRERHPTSLVDYCEPKVAQLSHMSVRDLITPHGVSDAACLVTEIADQEGWL